MCESSFRTLFQHPIPRSIWSAGCAVELSARKQHGICEGLQFLSLVLGVFLLVQAPVVAQVKQVRRVLILSDLGFVSSPGFAEIDRQSSQLYRDRHTRLSFTMRAWN